MKPIVAIVGRPNAGKSTLFNRITRSKDALVDDFPGVTRDRHFRDAIWDEKHFTVVDTGGFSTGDDDPFSEMIRLQIDEAIKDADAIVLILDGKGGVSPFDDEMIAKLRGLDKPVFYGINKIDSPEQENRLHDFYALGIDQLYPLSAEHGYGMTDFLDDVTAALPFVSSDEDAEFIRLAVVGRPNVGKSSLINRILGEDRHVVSDIPGTTRDAVDAVFKIQKKSYLLVDTAGIRRKGRVSLKLEKFSIIKSLRSLDRCHVALIVLDAAAGVTEQDIRVAGYAHDRGCGCIFVLNKWDLMDRGDAELKRLREDVRMGSKFLNFAPIITTSALSGLRVRKIFKLVDEVHRQYVQRVGTGVLNRIVEEAVQRNEPPLHKGRRLKFYYTTQVSTKPPTFVCFVNYPQAVHFSYKRYLVNKIREGTGLDRVPLRLLFRLRTGTIDFSKWKGKGGKQKKRKGRGK